MYGSDYLWVLPGYHQVDWWHNIETFLSTFDNTNKNNEKSKIQKHSCTNEQLNKVLQGHFVLEFASLKSNSNQILVSNRVIFNLLFLIKNFFDYI